jgi:uncharacterized membrane protein
MRFAGSDRVASWLLAVAFLVAAWAKISRFFLKGAWHALTPFLRDRAVMGSIIAIEICLAAALLVPRARRWAALLVLFFVVVANLYRMSEYGNAAGGYDCGCLGDTRVGPLHHALLSFGFVMLSAVILFARSRAGAARETGGTPTLGRQARLPSS